MPTRLHWPSIAAPPQLAADEVHVWAVPLDVSQRTYDGLLATLSLDEPARTAAYRFDEPRRRYVVTRGVLRQLLGKYLCEQASVIELIVDKDQKPRLASKYESTGINFNVSHSGDLALIGFAHGCEIGIDVEELREVSHLEHIVRKFFHPAETSEVLAAAADARNVAFLRCWTGKEAVLKALGKGIVADLPSFRIPLEHDARGWIEYREGPSRTSRCWLEQLDPCDNYLAAVACVESTRAVRAYTFEPSNA
jgi:4'-phosphopantetheinyl transferase